MTPLVKNHAASLLLFSCLILLAACGSKTGKVEKSDPVMLKDVVIDEATIFDNNRLQNSTKLSRKQLQSLSIRKIDSSAMENTVQYHLLDTLYSSSNKAVLIGREYAEENCVWLAIYAPDGSLIDSKLIYEDNSEGSYRINTVIKSNVITSTIMNEFSDSDKEVSKVFLVSPENRIVSK